MTHPLIVSSHAKLNLFLHITGKRTDGYHNLQTVFCRLDFADTLTFLPKGHHGLPTQNPWIFLDCPPLTKNPNDNLIVKAANLLIQHANPQNPTPISIRLDKRINTGAGLGGGSSNAASTLLALNALWSLNLDTQALICLGKQLGADVPFFLLNCPYAIGEHIGDALTPINLPHQQYLVLCPPTHNSTQAFFANPALKKDSLPLSHDDIKKNHQAFFGKLSSPFYNAFEAIAKDDPTILTAYQYLECLSSQTKTTPRLTGTGSSVFLPLGDLSFDEQASNKVKAWQHAAPCPAFIATSG